VLGRIQPVLSCLCVLVCVCIRWRLCVSVGDVLSVGDCVVGDLLSVGDCVVYQLENCDQLDIVCISWRLCVSVEDCVEQQYTTKKDPSTLPFTGLQLRKALYRNTTRKGPSFSPL